MPRSFVALVPTRNRAGLAQAAARALLAQQHGYKLSVVISDNSSDPAQVRELAEFVATARDPRLHYLRPERELAMAQHWDWALEAALERTGATHLLVNTDRMLMRPGAFAILGALAQRFPDTAISYNLDRVNDLAAPVVLERKRWSGALSELRGATLLEQAAHCAFPDCIPRLLNCVVPAEAIRAVRARFGDACVSISPDYAFGFRYAAVRPGLRFYDRSPLLHYAITRSNGTSFLRGVDSPDLTDFKRFLGEARFPAAPFPEFFTVGNALVHEYCAVRGRAPDALPPLDHAAYGALLCRDLEAAETPPLRALLRRLLEARGLGPEVRRRERRTAFKRRAKPIELFFRRLFRGPNVHLRQPAFPDLAAALAYDAANPPPRQDSTAHLARLRPRAVLRHEDVVALFQ